MPTNKNAYIRYQALDKCFRDSLHRYYLEDLIDKCEEALLYYNGVGGVSRRQIFEDIKFMESETGWSIPLDRIKEGKKVYYRYHYPGFSINKQPLTDEEAQQLRTVIITLSRFRGLPTNEWVEDVISNLEWRFKLRGKSENIIGFEQNEQLKGLNWLPTIIDATSNHQVIKVTYRNYKNSEVEINYQSAIRGLKVFGGYLDGLNVEFSDNLVTIIGGRGTGKSTIINFIRYALDMPPKERLRKKDYDEMLVLMPTFKSKDALKTAKYKCLKRLRDSVTGTYCYH